MPDALPGRQTLSHDFALWSTKTIFQEQQKSCAITAESFGDQIHTDTVVFQLILLHTSF